MRPSTLKPGDKLLIKTSLGSSQRTAYFIERVAACNGRKAVNYLRFPAYAGLDGLNDDGTCQMSDYDLSRRGVYA